MVVLERPGARPPTTSRSPTRPARMLWPAAAPAAPAARPARRRSWPPAAATTPQLAAHDRRDARAARSARTRPRRGSTPDLELDQVTNDSVTYDGKQACRSPARPTTRRSTASGAGAAGAAGTAGNIPPVYRARAGGAGGTGRTTPHQPATRRYGADKMTSHEHVVAPGAVKQLQRRAPRSTRRSSRPQVAALQDDGRRHGRARSRGAATRSRLARVPSRKPAAGAAVGPAARCGRAAPIAASRSTWSAARRAASSSSSSAGT